MKYFIGKVRGFSLLELVLSLALGLIILGALVGTFIVQRTTYDDQEQGAEMVQTARAVLDMIGREVMMGGYDPTGALQRSDDTLPTFSGIICDAGQLEIRADLDGSGVIATGSGIDPDAWTYDPNERIVYKLDGDILRRKVGGAGATFQPFAENITTFTFECLAADDTAATLAADIRQVRITIVSRTEKPGIGKGYDETEMESIFKIRNMGLRSASPSGGGGSTTTTIPVTTTTTTTNTTTTSYGDTTTTTGITTTTTTSTTTTSTTTTTIYIPDLYTEKTCEDNSTLGVGLEACSIDNNDYVLLRALVTKNNSPFNNATVTWKIGTETPLQQPVWQGNGWYGGPTRCNCGTFISELLCVKSGAEYNMNADITVTVTVDGCSLTWTTDR